MDRAPDCYLEGVFIAYIVFIREIWNDVHNDTGGGPKLLLLRSKAEIMSAAIEAAERSTEFSTLCDAHVDLLTAASGEPPDDDLRFMAAERLRCWLRRSGTYQAVCSEAPVDVRALCSGLTQGLSAQHQQIRHFVPIQNVRFNGNLDFGFFRILKLDKGELDQVLRNDVNQLFYPYAIVDTERLADCWLLEVPESRDAPSALFLSLETEANFATSGFPDAVEAALENICLFGWEESIVSEDGVNFVVSSGRVCIPRPRFPGVISVSDWLFERPAPAWALDSEGFIFDLNTPEKTAKFKFTVIEIALLFERVRSKAPFIQAARRFMVKGFFSTGLDQLLWHITAIEALLGENTGNLVDTLKRRLTIILGTTEKDKKAIRKDFVELYDFRSRLVHGDLGDLGGLHPGHLITARQMALASLLWMAQWLWLMVKNWPQDQAMPSRENILRFLDMPPDGRLQLKAMLDSLPQAIPPLPRLALFRDPNSSSS
jgi:hypothetical protein